MDISNSKDNNSLNQTHITSSSSPNSGTKSPINSNSNHSQILQNQPSNNSFISQPSSFKNLPKNLFYPVFNSLLHNKENINLIDPIDFQNKSKSSNINPFSITESNHCVTTQLDNSDCFAEIEHHLESSLPSSPIVEWGFRGFLSYFNCNEIKSKWANLFHYILNFGGFCISETKLVSEDFTPSIKGFNCFRKDRCNCSKEVGGGLLAFNNKKFQFASLSLKSAPKDLEYSFFKIWNKDFLYNIGFFYNPPYNIMCTDSLIALFDELSYFSYSRISISYSRISQFYFNGRLKCSESQLG